MAESEKTKALYIAFNKALKNLTSVRDSSPDIPWDMNQTDNTSEDAINRLIKNSPAGSAQRQRYMDMKAEYNKKINAYKIKFDQATKDFNTARDAYQASAKLDPLLKKQQDNKDTGVVDAKTDTEIDRLKTKVDAAPKTDGTVSEKQTPAASAAALGLSAADLARPSTVVEKVANDSSS